MTRKSSCTLCARKDTQNMVKCGSCQEWQHFTCAEVTREIEGKPYQCKHCKAKVGAGGEGCGATAGVHDESTDALRLCKVCYDVGMFKIKCVECKSFVHDNCAKYNSKDMVWMCSICINDESCKHMRNKGDKGKTGGYDNVDHCGVCGEGNMVDILVALSAMILFIEAARLLTHSVDQFVLIVLKKVKLRIPNNINHRILLVYQVVHAVLVLKRRARLQNVSLRHQVVIRLIC